MAGAINWVFLSEDRNMTKLKTLVQNCGYPMASTLFFSYKTSSNLEPARILATFLLESFPQVRVVIHRDRDFLTDQESELVENKIAKSGAIPFITEGSDVESYYVNGQHLAERLDRPVDEIQTWLTEVAQGNHNELQHSFTRKRDAVKALLYRANPNECPGTLALLGNVVPLPEAKRCGKNMLAKVQNGMHEKFGQVPDILQPTQHLRSPSLMAVLAAAQE